MVAKVQCIFAVCVHVRAVFELDAWCLTLRQRKSFTCLCSCRFVTCVSVLVLREPLYVNEIKQTACLKTESGVFHAYYGSWASASAFMQRSSSCVRGIGIVWCLWVRVSTIEVRRFVNVMEFGAIIQQNNETKFFFSCGPNETMFRSDFNTQSMLVGWPFIGWPRHTIAHCD